MDKLWTLRNNHRTLIALWILLKLGLCWAFDIHIAETEKVGKVLFNASLGSGWLYSLNSVRSSYSGLRLVGVDSFQGHVALLNEPQCASLVHNPFTVFINARTKTEDSVQGWDKSETLQSVQIPLRVHVHGKLCRSLAHAARHGGGRGKPRPRVRTRNQLKVNIHLGSDHGACIDRKFHILSLGHMIPSSPSNQCKVAKYSIGKNRHFRLGGLDGRLETIRLVCLQPMPRILHGEVNFRCVSGKQEAVPFKIVLSAREELQSYLSADPSMAIALSQATKEGRRSRSRRSADLPTFPQMLYVKDVQEEQGAGLVVGTFTILDPESHHVTYSLLATRDGRSQAMFTIDSSSGQVSTTQKLDREHINEHFFLVTATNTQNAHESGQATLIIKVEDVNDHAPKFESTTYPHSVSESMSIGATVLTVRASDEDSGPNGDIEYSILNPSGPNEVFRIDPRTGSVYTHGLLDRETVDFYRLHIQAADKGAIPNKQTATAEVEITILDENDNRPQFTKSSYTVDVSEDIDYSKDPVIAEIKATDRDEGNNAMVRYSITGGNNQNTFAIDAMTGQLSLLAPLDYEKASSYHLVVRAQDSGQPRRSNSTTVLVRVLDVNDNVPRFMPNVFEESVLESDPVGHIILRVQAFDADAGENSALLYSIVDAPKNLPIAIDQHSGILTTTKVLDRETKNRYAFKVEAKDQGTPARTATATIGVKVRDVNDNAPIFSPRTYYEVVSEEAVPGTPVVTVTARDSDENENGRVGYAITAGNERKAFTIISQMGQGLISVVRTLNYKEQSRYILSVTASDIGGLVDTATVFINVSDANTFRPLFQATPYEIRVAEDTQIGSTVFKVMATDGDIGENARITYSMDDNEAFQINPANGNILVKHPLDREKVPGFTVSVTASDHGHPAKSDTTDVEIVIVDVNDNSPIFRQTSYNGRVAEDAIVGTSILTLSAQDMDMGLNGRIRYTFEKGNNGGGDFMLDPTLGILRIAKKLDMERVSHYELRAFAIDRGHPPRSTSVVINIQIEDVNDNAPQFESSRINFNILENSPIGSTVDTIEARDPDDGVNSEVAYSIVGGPDADSFALRTRAKEPATITTLVELDYESGKTQYVIIIRARSFHLFSDATVIVHVIDVNDNVPQLKDFVIIFNNFRNHFPTGEVGRVPASDPDVNDMLVYRFISGNTAHVLHLNNETGMIRLDSRLNSDVPTNGTLQVSVSDGINEVKATCRLFVRLVTEDMLYTSVTLRLNAITQTAFLSPLYHRFVAALASIIPTTEDNIYVINVNDDTDVTDKILNVSFSVRQKVENNRDVYYSPQFLRERVYLQRTLLAKLSTLEVLPFDDNLCVREPCLNFEQCVSILKFGNASSFIGSDTMLFRPIHPINAFACQCPRGFTGMEAEYLCDTEVNLCFSSPCGGNGTCQRHEGGYTCHCNTGFTGENCEIDMRHKKYTAGCPSDVCKSGSHCTSLIRGGFRCEKCPDTGAGSLAPDSEDGSTEKFCIDCADIEHHTKFCELTTRSFPKGSFLMFPSLKRRHRFTIRLEFATRQKSGLLFYNGRYNEMHDFIALELVDGQVQFSFSLGTDITRAVAHVEGGVNDGNWHEVTVHYFNRTATLTVGDYCDTEVAVRYGKMIGNYTCAAKTTQVLHARCADITETCHRFLDLTGPFQLGGLPSLPTEFQVHNTDYVGCVRHMYLDDKFLDLNDYVWNNGTVTGCPQKRSFCLSAPCENGGTCIDSWHTYQCRCPPGWGGKDCSQAIEPPRMLTGTSYLTYTQGFPTIQLPWFNGIAFRTRQKTGLLMMIDMGRPNFVSIKIENGLINYINPERTVVMDTVLVNDGKWHYLETRWRVGKLILTLDYGQIQHVETIGDWVAGKTISRILVGGEVIESSGNKVVVQGFKGCVENVRVGSSQNSILTEPREHNVRPGCKLNDPCDANPCPDNSYCYNHWQKYTCSCEIGYVGSQCESICSKWNPCKNGATCKPTAASSDGYTCECPDGFSGQYCENSVDHACPATWWGTPICGPCNCPKKQGFNPSCNKTTGECYCKENHYRPKDSNTCFPCDCYSIGSWHKSCDSETGQCPCRNGVIGRRCDACSSRFAEVTLRGCEVVYDSCPRSFDKDLWWDRTLFGEAAIQSCPEGTLGDASRTCTEEGWQKSDLFNCTSTMFVDLRKQIEQIETDDLKVNTFVAKHLVSKLALATNETEKMYGMDINITYRILTHVMRHEERQAGLNLTHTQDRNFIQNLVDTVGRILEPRYQPEWRAIHATAGGAAELMERLEGYSAILAHNMLQLFTQPFDAVHKNIVFGLDYVVKDNRTSVALPKYNNKVQKEGMFDKQTKVFIPSKAFREPSMADLVAEEVGKKPTAVISYVLYRTIGEILPQSFAEDIRMPAAVPVTVNTPVFTLNIVDGNKSISGHLRQPISIDFRQLGQDNRTSPQCVYWRHLSSHPNDQLRGEWSSEGCKLTDRRDENHNKFVTCECSHLSSFAALMDISNIEYLVGGAVHLEAPTYAGVAVALLFLLATLILFIVLRGLHSNNNSILINLVLSIFISNLLFIAGVTAVDPKMGCKVVSILLHYFYMCTFSWMFVATLHIYRMMTEIRNIDQGSMKFYYVMGYVVPGIIVGLSVGLNTDAYGNKQFCWLRTNELIIWSFAGPICLAFVANVIILVMAFFAGCRAKQADPDLAGLRHGLRSAVVILPLLAMVWVFAVLAVNDNVVAFQYMYAACNVLLGFIFFLAHVIFNDRVRKELKHTIQGLQGKKLDETLGDTHTTVLSQRSALAYHNDSSLDGGINRMNIGISTTSTTSRSTSKSSGGMFRPDGYLGHSLSTSNSNNGPTSSHHYPPNAGIAPYGYDSSMFHDKPVDDPDTGELNQKRRARARRRDRDSDSDSELSAVEHPDMDLASSHSSDDDDDVNFQWDPIPKYKAVARVRGTPQVKPATPPGSQGPSHSTPAPPPPYSRVMMKSQWPGEGMSTTTASDTEIKSPEKIKISEVRPHADRQLPPIPGSPRLASLKGSRDFMSPPERVDSLPSDTNKPSSRDRIAVQVLTHNGSITSESETTSDSDSSDAEEQWA